MRLSKAEFLAAEALITKLNYRGRGQFFADAVKLMAMILEAVKDRSPEVKHEDLDFRDLEDLVARSAASLACLEKRLPIPVWAQLESSLPQVPRLEPPKP